MQYNVERRPTARPRGARDARAPAPDGRFYCTTAGCGQSFPTPHQCQAHELGAHLRAARAPPEDVVCPLCGARKRGPLGLSQHMRLTHTQGTAAQDGFRCALCPSLAPFTTQAGLTQHQDRMHPGGAPADPRAAPKRRGQNRKQTATRARSPGGTYVCTECNPEWRTPRQKEFLTHLTAVHGRQSHH